MTEVPDKRYIRVTGVYGKDNKLKNYKPSSPVNVDVLKIPMPKLDYEFNKGGAVVKKKKTKMMAKGGKVKGTKMYSKGGKVSIGR